MTTEMRRKSIFHYVLLVVLIECTLAGFIPSNSRWIEVMDVPPLQRKTTPVHNYWIRVKEGTSYIDENIRINTALKTERFHMFPSNNMDESVILNDFNKNRTIIKLPKKHQCFLQNLNPSIPPPQKLKSNIIKVIAFDGTNSTINIDISEKSTWKVQGTLFNRTLLTNEMKKLCANIPVYKIERTSGQLYLQGLKRQGRSPPFPRTPCGGEVCSYYWQLFCKKYIPGQGCMWVKVQVYGCQTITC